MQQLINQIEQRAEDRNLINGSTPQKQTLKLMEEFGKLCRGIARNNPEMIKDAIGDCFVILVILNKQKNWDINFDDYQDKMVARFIRSDIFEKDGLSSVEITHIVATIIPALYAKSMPPIYNDERYAIWSLLVAFSDIANIYDFSLSDCIEHAYDQIKDRRGEMRDGIWIKNEDL